ncbi:MAG: hypothetical protein PHN49_09550, partial [Candidatus Omnitrophica bacterium]|nr:hypothetical protein [Candidatus Omnitrophota bacterium]
MTASAREELTKVRVRKGRATERQKKTRRPADAVSQVGVADTFPAIMQVVRDHVSGEGREMNTVSLITQTGVRVNFGTPVFHGNAYSLLAAIERRVRADVKTPYIWEIRGDVLLILSSNGDWWQKLPDYLSFHRLPDETPAATLTRAHQMEKILGLLDEHYQSHHGDLERLMKDFGFEDETEFRAFLTNIGFDPFLGYAFEPLPEDVMQALPGMATVGQRVFAVMAARGISRQTDLIREIERVTGVRLARSSLATFMYRERLPSKQAIKHLLLMARAMKVDPLLLLIGKNLGPGALDEYSVMYRIRLLRVRRGWWQEELGNALEEEAARAGIPMFSGKDPDSKRSAVKEWEKHSISDPSYWPVFVRTLGCDDLFVPLPAQQAAREMLATAAAGDISFVTHATAMVSALRTVFGEHPTLDYRYLISWGRKQLKAASETYRDWLRPHRPGAKFTAPEFRQMNQLVSDLRATFARSETRHGDRRKKQAAPTFGHDLLRKAKERQAVQRGNINEIVTQAVLTSSDTPVEMAAKLNETVRRLNIAGIMLIEFWALPGGVLEIHFSKPDGTLRGSLAIQKPDAEKVQRRVIKIHRYLSDPNNNTWPALMTPERSALGGLNFPKTEVYDPAVRTPFPAQLGIYVGRDKLVLTQAFQYVYAGLREVLAVPGMTDQIIRGLQITFTKPDYFRQNSGTLHWQGAHPGMQTRLLTNQQARGDAFIMIQIVDTLIAVLAGSEQQAVAELREWVEENYQEFLFGVMDFMSRSSMLIPESVLENADVLERQVRHERLHDVLHGLLGPAISRIEASLNAGERARLQRDVAPMYEEAGDQAQQTEQILTEGLEALEQHLAATGQSQLLSDVFGFEYRQTIHDGRFYEEWAVTIKRPSEFTRDPSKREAFTLLERIYRQLVTTDPKVAKADQLMNALLPLSDALADTDIAELQAFEQTVRSEMRTEQTAVLEQPAAAAKAPKKFMVIDTWRTCREAFSKRLFFTVGEYLERVQGPSVTRASADEHFKQLAAMGVIRRERNTAKFGRPYEMTFADIPEERLPEIEFVISEYSQAFDLAFVRDQINRILQGRRLFTLPDPSRLPDLNVLEDALIIEDVDIRYPHLLIVFRLLNQYFGTTWVRATSFARLIEGLADTEIDRMRRFRELVARLDDLRLVETQADGTRGIWLRVRDFTAAQLKAIDAALLEESKTTERNRLRYQIEQIRKGTAAEQNGQARKNGRATPASLPVRNRSLKFSLQGFIRAVEADEAVHYANRNGIRVGQATRSGVMRRLEISDPSFRRFGEKVDLRRFIFGLKLPISFDPDAENTPEAVEGFVQTIDEAVNRLRSGGDSLPGIGAVPRMPISLVDLADELYMHPQSLRRAAKKEPAVRKALLDRNIFEWREAKQENARREATRAWLQEDLGIQDPSPETVDFAMGKRVRQTKVRPEDKVKITAVQLQWRQGLPKRRAMQRRQYIDELQQQAFERFKAAVASGRAGQIQGARIHLEEMIPGHPALLSTAAERRQGKQSLAFLLNSQIERIIRDANESLYSYMMSGWEPFIEEAQRAVGFLAGRMRLLEPAARQRIVQTFVSSFRTACSMQRLNYGTNGERWQLMQELELRLLELAPGAFRLEKIQTARKDVRRHAKNRSEARKSKKQTSRQIKRRLAKVKQPRTPQNPREEWARLARLETKIRQMIPPTQIEWPPDQRIETTNRLHALLSGISNEIIRDLIEGLRSIGSMDVSRKNQELVFMARRQFLSEIETRKRQLRRVIAAAKDVTVQIPEKESGAEGETGAAVQEAARTVEETVDEIMQRISWLTMLVQIRAKEIEDPENPGKRLDPRDLEKRNRIRIHRLIDNLAMPREVYRLKLSRDENALVKQLVVVAYYPDSLELEKMEGDINGLVKKYRDSTDPDNYDVTIYYTFSEANFDALRKKLEEDDVSISLIIVTPALLGGMDVLKKFELTTQYEDRLETRGLRQLKGPFIFSKATRPRDEGAIEEPQLPATESTNQAEERSETRRTENPKNIVVLPTPARSEMRSGRTEQSRLVQPVEGDAIILSRYKPEQIRQIQVILNKMAERVLVDVKPAEDRPAQFVKMFRRQFQKPYFRMAREVLIFIYKNVSQNGDPVIALLSQSARKLESESFLFDRRCFLQVSAVAAAVNPSLAVQVVGVPADAILTPAQIADAAIAPRVLD